MTERSTQCPVCLSDRTTSINEYLHICTGCRIAYNSRFEPKRYNDGYFLSEYRRQYGKTYLEDYNNIYSVSEKRLAKILKIIPGKKKPPRLSLLDIGSAAGFFLKCAQDSGITDLQGIEISEFAAAYCAETFRIPVMKSSFDDITLNKKYDIITAWFFIEHCGDPAGVINKIHDALNRGGVFAFSGPSISGPMYKFFRRAWVETHPSDHRIDFSPRFVKTFLKKSGFTKIYVFPAGIHPERLIAPGSMLYRPFSLLYTLYSRATAFSDTIEVYAVK